MAWLRDARATALAAKDATQAGTWQQELDALTTPAAEKK
jgi:hypothetical protein